MSEADFRGRVTNGLRHLDAIAVENPVYPGTPDVNYIEGWVELKWLREWPVLADTIVTIDHYTQQQRVWHRRRWYKGGRVFLLLQVCREYMLFEGDVASKHVGRVPYDELARLARRHWNGVGLPFDELALELNSRD